MCGTCSATLIDEQGIIAANPETVERSGMEDGVNFQETSN